MRKWSKNNYVFISEYNAPKDFIKLSSKKKFSTLSGKGSKDLRTEKLFAHESIKYKPLYNKLIKKSKKKSR